MVIKPSFIIEPLCITLKNVIKLNKFAFLDNIEEKSVFIESSLIDMEKAYEEHFLNIEKDDCERNEMTKQRGIYL